MLNGRGLTLVSVQLDGEVLAADRYQLDADTLQITGLIDQHEVTITSTCTPYSNTALEGLIPVICCAHNASLKASGGFAIILTGRM